MNDYLIYIYILIGAFVIAIINIRVFWVFQKSKKKIEKQEKEAREKLYEIAVLKELEERIGYSLDVKRVIDIVLGSVRQFIDYTCAGWMLIEGSQVFFKADLNTSINKTFLQEMKKRMFESLKTKTKKQIKEEKIVEILSGAIMVDEIETPLSSYFEIPLKLKGETIGMIAVSSMKEDLYKAKEMNIFEKIVEQTEVAVSRFEQALEMEKGKINSMVESMADGVIMTDQDSHIVVANPVAKGIIGIPPESKVSILDFVESLGGTFDIRGRLEESIALRKTVGIEEAKIGNRFFKIFVSPVKNQLDEEEILGGVVLFQDITHEKEIEQIRQDFTSMMVHDLRSPLDGIRKMIGLIKENEDKETTEKYSKMIFSSASEMLELVNGLLDVAKFQSGKFEIFTEDVKVKDFIQEKVEYYKPISIKKDIKLSINVGKNVPEILKFDPVRIGRVLNNLLSNALKFTQETGEISLNVFRHTKSENIFKEASEEGVKWFVSKDDKNIVGLSDCLLFSVTDNGLGIKKEDVDKIFEKFRQGSQKRAGEKQGTGLGLSIAKGIVEAHNGKINVSSIEEEGSTFWFSIPLT